MKEIDKWDPEWSWFSLIAGWKASKNCETLWLETLPSRVAEFAREHGWHPPKSLESDENFKPEHTLSCRELRFVAIYALFFGGYFFRGRFFLWILDINLQDFVRGFFFKFLAERPVKEHPVFQSSKISCRSAISNRADVPWWSLRPTVGPIGIHKSNQPLPSTTI